jgi:hypothetical protein
MYKVFDSRDREALQNPDNGALGVGGTGTKSYTPRRRYAMSDHEKYEQVGKLAEEVGHLKGKLNQVNEKLTRAYWAYQRMAQSQSPNNWDVTGETLLVPSNVGGGYNPGGPADLNALLDARELTAILQERKTLQAELDKASERLRGLAPNLL